MDWEGYGPKECSWVPARDILDSELIREFRAREGTELEGTSGAVPRRGGPVRFCALLIRIIRSSPDSFLIPYLCGPLCVTLAGLLNYAIASGSSVSFFSLLFLCVLL